MPCLHRARAPRAPRGGLGTRRAACAAKRHFYSGTTRCRDTCAAATAAYRGRSRHSAPPRCLRPAVRPPLRARPPSPAPQALGPLETATSSPGACARLPAPGLPAGAGRSHSATTAGLGWHAPGCFETRWKRGADTTRRTKAATRHEWRPMAGARRSHARGQHITGSAAAFALNALARAAPPHSRRRRPPRKDPPPPLRTSLRASDLNRCNLDAISAEILTGAMLRFGHV